MKTTKPLVIVSTKNVNLFLAHSGHNHYWSDASNAMHYYDTEVAQALADKYDGSVREYR